MDELHVAAEITAEIPTNASWPTPRPWPLG